MADETETDETGTASESGSLESEDDYTESMGTSTPNLPAELFAPHFASHTTSGVGTAMVALQQLRFDLNGLLNQNRTPYATAHLLALRRHSLRIWGRLRLICLANAYHTSPLYTLPRGVVRLIMRKALFDYVSRLSPSIRDSPHAAWRSWMSQGPQRVRDT
jgi:hypothetical protein